MLFIFIAIFAQFINAIVALIDKHLVTSRREIADPTAYAFYVGLLSGVVVVIIPFIKDFTPTPGYLLLSLASSVSFLFSILFMYKALKVSDASDVAPAVGAMAAISSFVFGRIIIGGVAEGNFFWAFIALSVGTALMSYFRFNKKTTLYLVVGGIMLGLSVVLVKAMFLKGNFLDGFFWSRMTNVAAAALLLIRPQDRKVVFSNIKATSSKSKFLLAGNKLMAGAAFLLILIAVNLGDVAIVNALGGLQFIFLLIFALIFTRHLPDFMYEDIHSKHVFSQKMAAILLIVVGMVMLFI